MFVAPASARTALRQEGHVGNCVIDASDFVGERGTNNRRRNRRSHVLATNMALLTEGGPH